MPYDVPDDEPAALQPARLHAEVDVASPQHVSAPHPARWRFALSGMLAAAAGLASAHLVAALLNPAASPVLAVGAAVIDATPTPVKEFAVAQFGTADKPILLASVSLAVLSLAALAGVVAQKRPCLAVLLVFIMTAAAGLAALVRPTATWIDMLPAATAFGVATGSLLYLRRVLLHRAPEVSAQDLPESQVATDLAPRRQFLVAAGLLGAVSACAGWLGIRINGRTSTAAVALPQASVRLKPVPAGVTAPGVSALVTTNEDFYRVDINLSVPRIDLDEWRLTVDGDVGEAFSLSYAELLSMPMIESDITLTCVSNEVGGSYVGGARWLGVPVRDLLARAKVGGGVEQILSTSVDGFTISTPVQALMDDRNALLAVGMNGKPLPAEHGFPARLVTPGLYGFVGATKWLTKLTATTYDTQAYWTERDWAIDAPVKTMSRVDTPRPLSTIAAGPTVVGGVAWAQRRGISAVEVSIDGGQWQRTTVGPDVNIDYWRQWFMPWDAKPGRHTIEVRATDQQGDLQVEQRAKPFPNGASGWQQVVVFVE